jgi:hypothetical protein
MLNGCRDRLFAPLVVCFYDLTGRAHFYSLTVAKTVLPDLLLQQSISLADITTAPDGFRDRPSRARSALLRLVSRAGTTHCRSANMQKALLFC